MRTNFTGLYLASSVFLAACSGAGSEDAPPRAADALPDAAQSGADDAAAIDGGRGPGTKDGAAPVDSGGEASVDAGAEAVDAAPFDAGSLVVDAAPISLEEGDGGVVTFDIVSPERCIHLSHRLYGCVFAPVTVHDSSSATAPVHSVITVHRTGDCSSQIPLSLILSATDATTVRFHLEDHVGTIRRIGDGAISDLSIGDGNASLTHLAMYDESCRITADVEMNVPGAV